MKKRSDGRYCKQIIIGYNPNGTRIVKTVYGKTIKEVEKKEREIRNSIDNGIDLINENITVSEWSAKWLAVYKTGKSRSTYNMYETCIKNHINPRIGNISLSHLKPIHVQESINNILLSGSIRTAEIFKLTIKQIISQAVAEGLVLRNVCDNLEKIKSQREEKRVLTEFELKCISQTNYTDRERLFLDLMYYTGIRRGEALALTINDIDRKNRVLKINKSLDIKENVSIIKEPKTKAGYRDIPIPDLLYESLIAYINKLDSIYIFAMKNGEPPSRSSFRRMWENIMDKTIKKAKEIQNENDQTDKLKVVIDTSISFTPHIFRHTYATNLYYATNKDIKRIQYLLGHSSLDMTLKIYTHLENKNNADIASKINAFFVSQKSVKPKIAIS